MSIELLVSRFGDRSWAAIRENGSVVEIRSERAGETLGAGQIFKGRVSRVLPGIQSAFLDLGLGRDAFLHVADLVLPDETTPASADPSPVDGGEVMAEDDSDEDDGESFAPPHPHRRANVSRSAPIEDRLRVGSEVLVQVERESIGNKGARVTAYVSLPGRYVVFMPYWSYRGISRRILDPDERDRLRAVLDGLAGEDGGFIVRTAGQGVPEEALRADAARLRVTWREVLRDAGSAPAPSRVHADLDLLLRLLRDAPRGDVERVVVDDPADRDRALEYLRDLDPSLAARIRLHTGPVPLFEATGVDHEIDRALRPKVWLRSGGSLVIEQTEALVSIDVNTGKFVGKRHPEETVLRTNLEAAAEIARQLRLRDLGGIIVIDFIDMDRADSRRQVIAALETALSRDRARTKIVGLSELGLLQLTRKRTRAALADEMTRPCPLCGGHGRVKSAETVAAQALAEARRLLPQLPDRPLTIRVHSDVAPRLRLALQTVDAGLPGDVTRRVRVEADPHMRPDAFDVLAV